MYHVSETPLKTYYSFPSTSDSFEKVGKLTILPNDLIPHTPSQ